MSLRELVKLTSLENLAKSLSVPPVTRKEFQISTVSNDSSNLEKELLESLAYARLTRSPLHREISKYLLKQEILESANSAGLLIAGGETDAPRIK